MRERRELLIKRAADGYIAERIDVTELAEAEIDAEVRQLAGTLDLDCWSIHDTGRGGAARW